VQLVLTLSVEKIGKKTKEMEMEKKRFSKIRNNMRYVYNRSGG